MRVAHLSKLKRQASTPVKAKWFGRTFIHINKGNIVSDFELFPVIRTRQPKHWYISTSLLISC